MVRPKAAPDSTPAATHSLGDRIATGDHTPGAPRSFAAKRHTELRAAAVATDRNQMAGRRRLLGSRAAGHSRLASYSGVAGHKRKAGHSREADRRRVAGHKQMADCRVMGLHPRLRRDQEKFRWRAALPWWQSQRRGGAWHPLFDVASIALKNSVEQLKGFLLTDVKAGLQRKHRQVCGTAPNEEAGDGTNEGVGWLRCLTFAESFAGRESITPGIRSPHLGGIDPLAAGSTEPRDQLNTVHAEIGRLVANTFGT